MKKRQYARKPAPDTSVLSAGNLLQTRPFQADSINQQTPQVQKESEALTGGFDLTKQYVLNPPTTVSGQPLQAKLTIGEPNDKYEQEADRVAHDVVQQINSPQRTGNSGAVQKLDDKQIQRQKLEEEDDDVLQTKLDPNTIQRDELEEEDEDVLQAKIEANIVQRDELEEDEDELQMKPDRVQLQDKTSSPQNLIQADFESNLNKAKGGGSPLDPTFRSKVEPAMGADFSGVRIHADAKSDQLSQSIQAKAFTTGQDVFFRQGKYQPNSQDGQELITHELTHVVQQNAEAIQTAHLENVVQRKFHPAIIDRNAHLRDKGAWDTYVGPQITKGTEILVDNDTGKAEKQNKLVGSTTWKPAVNVDPHQTHNNINGNRRGYIRDKSIKFQSDSLDSILNLRIKTILQTAEGKFPSLAGHLDKDENIKFLLDKGIRYDAWNNNPDLDSFVSGLTSKEDKMARIRDGANYVADSLEYWRNWLHPTQSNNVKIQTVKFLKSDLHEQGLGVLEVTFTKPQGPIGHKFANDTTVTTILKPEDKSLEDNLLGDKSDSAASQINELLGLSDSEALATIKMACNLQYGSLVEKVKGTKAEDLTGHSNLRIEPAFHETLVFAFLAGIDDLHGENVYWHQGKPYLIDADNVLSYNQMINKANGAFSQSGFGQHYSQEEANKNKEALVKTKNTVKSKLLKTLIENPVKAAKIIDIIKNAVAGKNARVVPIRTRFWGQVLEYYTQGDDRSKNNWLNDCSKKGALVREKTGFDSVYGPGLFGTSYKNVDNEFYDEDAEKAELKKDFDAGVIPFYTYHFSTGYVYHNGTKIYHGQTAEQAMQIMIDKFSPEWDREWNEYMQLRQGLDEI